MGLSAPSWAQGCLETRSGCWGPGKLPLVLPVCPLPCALFPVPHPYSVGFMCFGLTHKKCFSSEACVATVWAGAALGETCCPF